MAVRLQLGAGVLSFLRSLSFRVQLDFACLFEVRSGNSIVRLGRPLLRNTVLIVLLNTRKTDRDPLCPIARFRSVWRRGLAAFALTTCGALLNTVASAQTGSHGIVDVSSLSYKGAISKASYTRPAQSVLTGQVQLAVKLSDPPLVAA